MLNRYRIIVIIIIASLFSCNKFENINTEEEQTIEDLIIADNFDYETAQEITIQLIAKDNNDNPLANVRFDIYTKDPEEDGQLILSGVTNNDGVFTREYEFPAFYTEAYISTRYIGLPHLSVVNIQNNRLELTVGGSEPALKSTYKSLKSTTEVNYSFSYLGGYDSNGVPDYLETVNDVIDDEFLEDVNNTLPEQIQLPIGHPQYFSENNRYDLSLIERCNVFVTFVHEGAGYKNTLGFYVYDTDNPPTSVDDIEDITIIFPNISYLNYGGGLISGNKVKIGQFTANKSIGWVLFPNAWQGGQVTNSYYKFFSNPDFNPETTTALKQHTVLLNDLGRNLILLGIEDLKREGGGCDHDFNDAVFYVTADPVQAVDLSNLPSIDYTGTDSDSDGVKDEFDDYPEDGDKAFNNYFFTEGSYGTLAFEDMWPGTGDYDFNDMVIDYNFNQITNADNQVVEIYGKFILKAFGASFHNGFGIDLGINPNLISQVSGYKLQESWPNINNKGLENNQSNAVFLVFDDTYNLMNRSGGIGVNTDPSFGYVTPDTTNIHITFSQPVDLESIGIPPYNPFIIIDQNRGHEIHLPDHPPTDLATQSLFNTYRDNSNAAIGRYYKTENNLPWAIKTIEHFDYPKEKAEIISTHLKFAEWAESNGTLFNDWYKDNNGYRNASNIYIIPN